MQQQKSSEKRESQKRGVKEKNKTVDQSGKKLAKKVEKLRSTVLYTCIFPLLCGSGAKAAGVEPSGGMRDQKLHAVLARS